MRLLSVGLVCLLMAGCASSAIPVDEASNAPASDVFSFQSKGDSASAKITALRDKGVVGSACDIVVYIDGKKAANLGTGEKASFWVQPGVRNVSIGSSNNGLCGGNALRTLSADLKSGEERIFRISIDVQGIYLNPYVEY